AQEARAGRAAGPSAGGDRPSAGSLSRDPRPAAFGATFHGRDRGGAGNRQLRGENAASAGHRAAPRNAGRPWLGKLCMTRTAAGLAHSNIVPIYAVGCERGVHYYAMQFIDGLPLDQVIAGLRESGVGGRESGIANQESGNRSQGAGGGEATLAENLKSEICNL